ncbi:MAG: DUF1343 domain-containing protein [Candidatus Aminicenantes bacterium]|nr:DUF1343 domain-containing protein [Candidatus Aminicenantes bacterium]
MKKSPALFLIIFPMIFSAGKVFPKSPVILGNERFVADYASRLKGKKLGLVINHTSVLPSGISLLQALEEKGFIPAAIFAPEHGLSGQAAAGIHQSDGRMKDIPLYSLYGQRKKPAPEQISRINALVYDIQDIGARFYTYISTMKYVIEAGAEAGIPVYILDRPNPVGGNIIEGPLLRKEHESFIGSVPIPVRYGLTCGELALMMKGEGWVSQNVDLHVIPMKNWKRSEFWEDTGLEWIPPSPNIPTPETAIIYPGTGLLEAVGVNAGIGTILPFLQFGAPWIEPQKIITSLSEGEEFGLRLSPTKFYPIPRKSKTMHPLYEYQVCPGVHIEILHKEKLHSFRFTLFLIEALKVLYPGRISPDVDRLNLIFGTKFLVNYLQGKISRGQAMLEMEEEERLFRRKRAPYLLY